MKNFTDKQRIIIYIAVTFVLTYAYEILFLPGALASAYSSLFVAAAMLFPAIGSLITRLITREGFKNMYIRPNLKVKGNLKIYAAAYFGPSFLILLGVALYFAVFPGQFSPLSLDLSAGVNIIIAMIISPIVNIIFCFGEELGWRGYLVPKLAKSCSFIKTALISGVIWGLWHAPLTVMGHNYGLVYAGWPYTGILAMCVFSTAVGTVFSYWALKTESCLPAALAHGSLNGMGSVGLMFMVWPAAANPFIGPLVTGVVGGLPFLAAAVWLILKYKTHTGSPDASLPH